MKCFRDADPETFAELQNFISTGEQRLRPGVVVLNASERQALLSASAILRVTGRCECGDPECKSYEFASSDEQGRPIQFEAGVGIAVVFVSSDGDILSFERIQDASKMIGS
jgi:hypothetical protein